MLKDRVSEFALVKFKMTEYTQYKILEYETRVVLVFNVKTVLSMEERSEQSYCRGTSTQNRLKNRVCKTTSPFC